MNITGMNDDELVAVARSMFDAFRTRESLHGTGDTDFNEILNMLKQRGYSIFVEKFLVFTKEED